ncbi:MAG: hypothetical protein AAF907_10275, partial [Planctomycetota bacterium]
ISRSVVQDDLAGTELKWHGVRPVEMPDRIPDSASLTDLPTNKKGDSWLAWGDFAAAADMPAHLVDEQTAASRTTRDPLIIDHGILTEYRWREVIRPTEQLIKELNALSDARAKLLSAWIDHREAMLSDGLPEGVDAAPLVDWVRADGDELTDELMMWFLQDPIWEKDEHAISEADRRRARLPFEAHGIRLPEDLFGLPEKDPDAAAFDRFVTEFIRQHVRTADDEPVDAERAERARWLLGIPNFAEHGLQGAPGRTAELAAIERRAAISLCGSAEAQETRMEALFIEFVLPLLIMHTRTTEFDYRHTMPGTLLETNGEKMPALSSGSISSREAEQTPASRVRFRFRNAATFPDGREMFAWSALIDEDAQEALLGTVAVRSPAEISLFLELVADPVAGSVWQECLERESVDPLRADDAPAVRRLRTLLLAEPADGDAGESDPAF